MTNIELHDLKVSLDLPRDLNECMDKQRKKLGGMSRASFIRMALIKFVTDLEAGRENRGLEK